MGSPEVYDSIVGYAAYAYISWLCLPMIENRPGSCTTGSEYCSPLIRVFSKTIFNQVVLLVVFSILYLWIIWAYIKVRIITTWAAGL